ncbi:hypothetical protein RCL1_008571 [Eukaryota sp. TZLM3-RCL]
MQSFSISVIFQYIFQVWTSHKSNMVPAVVCPAYSISPKHSPKRFISHLHSETEPTSCSTDPPAASTLISSFNSTQKRSIAVSIPKTSHNPKVFLSKDHVVPDPDNAPPGAFKYEQFPPPNLRRAPAHKVSGSNSKHRFISSLHAEANGPPTSNPSAADYFEPDSPYLHGFGSPKSKSKGYSLGLKHSEKEFISNEHASKSTAGTTVGHYLTHSDFLSSKSKATSIKGPSNPKVFISTEHVNEFLCRETVDTVIPLKIPTTTGTGPKISFAKNTRSREGKRFMGTEFKHFSGGSSGSLGPGSYNINMDAIGKAGLKARELKKKVVLNNGKLALNSKQNKSVRVLSGKSKFL